MENDEKKYEDIIKLLTGLKKVNAPENFETDLLRRINSEKFSKKEIVQDIKEVVDIVKSGKEIVSG